MCVVFESTRKPVPFTCTCPNKIERTHGGVIIQNVNIIINFPNAMRAMVFGNENCVMHFFIIFHGVLPSLFAVIFSRLVLSCVIFFSVKYTVSPMNYIRKLSIGNALEATNEKPFIKKFVSLHTHFLDISQHEHI